MEFNTNRLYSPKEIIVKNGGPLPISISTVYKAIKSGELPTKNIRGRKMIPGKFLAKYLENN